MSVTDSRTAEQAQATEHKLVKQLAELLAERDGQLAECQRELSRLKRENREANERPDA